MRPALPAVAGPASRVGFANGAEPRWREAALEFVLDVRSVARREGRRKILARRRLFGDWYVLKYGRARSLSGPAGWMRSPARRALGFYPFFRSGGILCPEHLFWWESRPTGLANEWGLCTRFEADLVPIYDYLRRPAGRDETARVSSALGEMLGTLHSMGVSYRAVDETNVVVRTTDDGEWKLGVVELEHCRRGLRGALAFRRDLRDALCQLGIGLDIGAADGVAGFGSAYAAARGRPELRSVVERARLDACEAFRLNWNRPPGWRVPGPDARIKQKLVRFVPLEGSGMEILRTSRSGPRTAGDASEV